VVDKYINSLPYTIVPKLSRICSYVTVGENTDVGDGIIAGLTVTIGVESGVIIGANDILAYFISF
jgi:hypothetical protein